MTQDNLLLDASVLDDKEALDTVREDVRLNRVMYVFPEGLNQVDLFEECRALTRLDDFDTMYDLTMQMLTGKPVVILLKCLDGNHAELCSLQVVDRYQNLRAIETIDRYPYLVVWLTEFIGAHLAKKISNVWQDSAAAAGDGKNDRGGEEDDLAKGGCIVKQFFGDELLFACYEFLHEMHIKPESFTELFEFLRYTKAKNIMREVALAAAKSGTQNG